jgi:hypothetical protein
MPTAGTFQPLFKVKLVGRSIAKVFAVECFFKDGQANCTAGMDKQE